MRWPKATASTWRQRHERRLTSCPIAAFADVGLGCGSDAIVSTPTTVPTRTTHQTMSAASLRSTTAHPPLLSAKEVIRAAGGSDRRGGPIESRFKVTARAIEKLLVAAVAVLSHLVPDWSPGR